MAYHLQLDQVGIMNSFKATTDNHQDEANSCGYDEKHAIIVKLPPPEAYTGKCKIIVRLPPNTSPMVKKSVHYVASPEAQTAVPIVVRLTPGTLLKFDQSVHTTKPTAKHTTPPLRTVPSKGTSAPALKESTSAGSLPNPSTLNVQEESDHTIGLSQVDEPLLTSREPDFQHWMSAMDQATINHSPSQYENKAVDGLNIDQTPPATPSQHPLGVTRHAAAVGGGSRTVSASTDVTIDTDLTSEAPSIAATTPEIYRCKTPTSCDETECEAFVPIDEIMDFPSSLSSSPMPTRFENAVAVGPKEDSTETPKVNASRKRRMRRKTKKTIEHPPDDPDLVFLDEIIAAKAMLMDYCTAASSQMPTQALQSCESEQLKMKHSEHKAEQDSAIEQYRRRQSYSFSNDSKEMQQTAEYDAHKRHAIRSYILQVMAEQRQEELAIKKQQQRDARREELVEIVRKHEEMKKLEKAISMAKIEESANTKTFTYSDSDTEGSEVSSLTVFGSVTEADPTTAIAGSLRTIGRCSFGQGGPIADFKFCPALNFGAGSGSFPSQGTSGGNSEATTDIELLQSENEDGQTVGGEHKDAVQEAPITAASLRSPESSDAGEHWCALCVIGIPHGKTPSVGYNDECLKLVHAAHKSAELSGLRRQHPKEGIGRDSLSELCRSESVGTMVLQDDDARSDEVLKDSENGNQNCTNDQVQRTESEVTSHAGCAPAHDGAADDHHTEVQPTSISSAPPAITSGTLKRLHYDKHWCSLCPLGLPHDKLDHLTYPEESRVNQHRAAWAFHKHIVIDKTESSAMLGSIPTEVQDAPSQLVVASVDNDAGERMKLDSEKSGTDLGSLEMKHAHIAACLSPETFRANSHLLMDRDADEYCDGLGTPSDRCEKESRVREDAAVPSAGPLLEDQVTTFQFAGASFQHQEGLDSLCDDYDGTGQGDMFKDKRSECKNMTPDTLHVLPAVAESMSNRGIKGSSSRSGTPSSERIPVSESTLATCSDQALKNRVIEMKMAAAKNWEQAAVCARKAHDYAGAHSAFMSAALCREAIALMLEQDLETRSHDSGEARNSAVNMMSSSLTALVADGGLSAGQAVTALEIGLQNTQP